jgi:thioredoxin-dependent peroxiredoxin
MENQTAPIFALPDQFGQLRALADYKGAWLVLFFYPKDFTPGCTTEVCNLRDHEADITAKTGAQIVGISRDDIESHQKFIKMHNLEFTLLSDPEATVVRQYDAEGPTIYDGKHEVLRKTFLIDPQGVVRKVYEQVTPDNHAEQVISDLLQLQATK